MTTRFLGALAVVIAAVLGISAPVAAQSGAAQSSQATQSAATLRPGDLLRIDVWPDNTLSGQFVVEETGLVYLPFLGAVPAAGVSLDLLRKQLRDGYGEILKEPVVTITPVFHVGISGGIRRPGIYQVTPTQNILDLILQAGGFVDKAKEDQVEIVRQGQVLKYNVERALEGAADLDALTLRSGDQVVVPLGSSFQFRYLLQGLTFVSTTILLVERILN